LPLYYLSIGDYQKALESLTPAIERTFPWLKEYLIGLIEATQGQVRIESEHFIFFVPKDQEFLKDYALPSLEKSASHIKKVLGHRAKGRVRVEIYGDKDLFSAASTLSEETLERSGAIGICKFHRLMIVSPRALPLGYRWLDALSHEYNHLIINELTYSQAELWLHEGTAKYFDTSYRSDPPVFITPHQKTLVLEALEEDRLIPFKKMSPSLVYLKDQAEVSLAFAQVSHAISYLVRDRGVKKFVQFLKKLRQKSFRKSFSHVYGLTPDEFERNWQQVLKGEPWEKSKGTMSDEVRFSRLDEYSVIGSDAKGRVRLGDRMRKRGHTQAALIEYEKALKEEPDNAIILLKVAKSHILLDQPAKAIEPLRRATQKNPNYGTPHLELAQLVGPQEARIHLIEANAINPFDPRIHFLLSHVYMKLHLEEESIREKEIFEILIGKEK